MSGEPPLHESGLGAEPPAPPTPSGAPSLNAQAGRGLIVAAVVVAANLAVYGLARLVDVPMVLPEPGDGEITRLPVGAVVAASVTAVAMGALALALLRQFAADRADLAFTVLVLVFVLVSLSAPLSLDTDTATKAVLVLMHLLTAAVTLVGLTRPVRARG
jgi:hypothetical protein